MRKTILIITTILFFISCKNKEEKSIIKSSNTENLINFFENKYTNLNENNAVFEEANTKFIDTLNKIKIINLLKELELEILEINNVKKLNLYSITCYNNTLKYNYTDKRSLIHTNVIFLTDKKTAFKYKEGDNYSITTDSIQKLNENNYGIFTKQLYYEPIIKLSKSLDINPHTEYNIGTYLIFNQ